ncbi:MAG TPA: hemolysin family protein [Cyclobacteriaceae bacterium]
MDPLPIIIVSLIFSALFSGLEIAYVTSNKLALELLGKQNTLIGRVISVFQNNPSQFIGTTLVGNTLALVVYGIFMAKILEPVFAANFPAALQNQASILVVQTIVSTIIVLVTAEFTPKSIFLINPNRMLSLLAFPMVIIYYLMYPVVFAIVKLSKLIITKVFRREYYEDRPVFGLTDLNQFIKQLKESGLDEGKVGLDTKIFHNALEFKTVRVRECMIPRTEITAVEVYDAMETVKKAFVDSGHSKVIVYRDSIDEVLGYIHSSELFKKPKSLEDIITPIIIVPETMLANELMIRFIKEHKSLSLVVDEFGGTSGLVSIEDIIEEIFGEIQDEHDDEDLIEQQLDANTWLLSARHEIDYLNDKYGWEIPTGDYETLGGLILSAKEDLPKKDEQVVIAPFRFTIITVQDIRIDTVKLHIDQKLRGLKQGS